MRWSVAMWSSLVAMIGCAAPPASVPTSPRADDAAPARVVMISVDGMMPEAYTAPDAHGLKVPVLRRLAAGGAFASRVESVFPTVTYPAHTTLVTGAPPGVHGITTNRPPDALDRNQGGWRWYAEDIAVPTLWQAAEAAGRPVGLVTWPVTVGAEVRYRIPEYWRAGTADDQKLLRALSTPGVLDEVERAHPALWQELAPPNVKDDAQFAIARHLLLERDAELVLVHVWQTDDAQHTHGPWSAEAIAAYEHVDALLGELIAALERTPAWSRTVVVVVSDHGFAPVEREIRLGALLDERRLRPRVTPVSNGGVAFLYVDDAAVMAEVEAAVASLGDAVARVYRPDELAARGADPRAALGLVAAPGHSFSDAREPPIVEASASRGTHGWPPDDAAMGASFLAYGPRVPARALGEVKMIDIAPTVAAWLHVRLRGATGTPLEDLVP